MCGIAGFTQYNRPLDNAEAVVRAMTNQLLPRGPDGEGYLVKDCIALGHRRLSIIDLEGGKQPMTLASHGGHMVYNGEIYNYIELRNALVERGHTFQTHSDTEVVLRQYIEYGERGLSELNGMFAFAIWDEARQQLFLARDKVGKKPIYYAVCNDNLIFASELKALLKYPLLERKINHLSVSKYLTYGYVPAPHTIFENIHKLEPGHYLTFSGRGLTRTAYWDIPLEDNPICGLNLEDCSNELMLLLEDAVKKRLRSDVPVGVFLSGGIDSSIVTALAAKNSTKRLSTFSIGFEEASYDESPYAQEVAARYNTEHHHEVLSSRQAVELLPTVLKILDEPFADASILPTYLLSQFTGRFLKTVLGGDGGDELFAGYPSFQAHKVMERLSFLPTTWRNALNQLAKRLPVSHRYASLDFLLQQFFKGAGISPEIRFMLWMGYLSNDQKKQLLLPEVRSAIAGKNPFEDVISYVSRSQLISDFQRILYLCMKLYLQDGVLVKVDRASMANSLEVRAPFLDYRVVEFMAGVQDVYKLKGLTTKYLLKHASKPYLPKSIIHRRKAGFMIPLASWIEKDLRAFVEEACSDEAIQSSGVFSAPFVRQLLKEHFDHVRDHRKVIWSIVCYQVWYRNYAS